MIDETWICFCLVSLIALSACSSPVATATTTPTAAPPTDVIQVKVDGSGDYPTLERAVAAAAPRATIDLGPGTYRLLRALEIDKSISLAGAGMNETEIVSGAGDYVVRFVGDGLFTAEGITFRHDGKEAADIVVVRGGRVDLSRCRFSGARYVEGEGNRAGLRFQRSTAGSVRECVVEDNDNTGILLENGAAPTLERNTCSDNKAVGIGYMDTTGGVARENECVRNAIGIAVAVEARPTLERNVCSDNDYGIAYLENAGGRALQNVCTGNEIGIVVGESAGPELVESECRDNTTADVDDRR